MVGHPKMGLMWPPFWWAEKTWRDGAGCGSAMHAGELPSLEEVMMPRRLGSTTWKDTIVYNAVFLRSILNVVFMLSSNRRTEFWQ